MPTHGQKPVGSVLSKEHCIKVFFESMFLLFRLFRWYLVSSFVLFITFFCFALENSEDFFFPIEYARPASTNKKDNNFSSM